MNFGEALEAVKKGNGMRLPSWSEDVAIYAQYPDENSKMTAPYLYVQSRFGMVPWKETMIELFSEDWEVVETENTAKDDKSQTMDFGEALKALRNGKHLTRIGWNGKGLSVAYLKRCQVPCNKHIAEVWGLKEGDIFKCNPCFLISTVDGSHATWVPSINDCLAEDWMVVGETNKVSKTLVNFWNSDTEQATDSFNSYSFLY